MLKCLELTAFRAGQRAKSLAPFVEDHSAMQYVEAIGRLQI